ncbi:MAG: response regulator [Ruminococcus sp.]|nr:response regulator [Ruminococcus sp.]
MKFTIVIAEDEELLLNNLCQKIQAVDPDFTVIGKAQTGTKAYELIKSLHPDILMTDIRMPVMNGIELLKKVRSEFPLTKCIIISGFSDFEYARNAISLHVSDYLLKPIDPEELAKTLSSLKRELSLLYLSGEQTNLNNTANLSSTQLAELIHDYLTENFTKEINLNQIAADMNYSPSYLTKIFVQHYDCTPSKYLINLKLQFACKLLIQNPEISIKQIGEQIGYHDQAYFSRFFKKYTGKSPYEYRNNSILQ